MLIPLLVGLTTAGAVIALLAYAATTVESRIAGRTSLRAIEEYTWKDHEPVAQEPAFIDRVVKPIYESLIGLGKRFTPVGYVENVKEKLIHAGRRGPDELDRFLAVRVATVAAIPFAGLFFALAPVSGRNALAMFLLIAVILGIGPDAKLNQQVSKRQSKIRRSLPDVLDLLTISVEAGLGFEQAIDRISEAMPGPLTDEFNRMIGEMRAGSSRGEALQALDQRIGVDEVKSFVLSMIQADQFGVSIGRVLRAQADEMRIKRRQLAQEAAQKAPVKMLLPMTFLIFPALFVVILGPAMYNIATTL